jgi:carboxypeptidase family protein
MTYLSWRSVARFLLLLSAIVTSTIVSYSQQTLGSVNGTVLDPSGAAVSGATITVTNSAINLIRTAKSQTNGYFQVFDLPIGTYSVKVSHDGFDTTEITGIAVQEERAATVNATLKVGKTSEQVEVVANPLLNATDTTNGYTLDAEQIQITPLATGSFTQLAILAPGVSAEMLNGTGSNAGLGNQPIWANGQRDTSNTFLVNGVDVTNLFNGKSSSQSTSQRLNFNIGEQYEPGGGTLTSTSVYGSNGNGLASPPPQFMQEITVTTSMYDAQQGQTAGAHVDIATATGGDKYHGQVYGVRGTDWLNAAPFFWNQLGLGVPELHRYTLGATLGGPILQKRLFFFLGYQRQQADDQYGGLSETQVPFGLGSDRSAQGLVSALNSWYAASGETNPGTITANNIDNAALMLLNAKLSNGNFVIPSSSTSGDPFMTRSNYYNSITKGTSEFKGDQADAALDFNPSNADHLSLKYFYQHTPAAAPFAVSQTEGFPESEDSGAQVASISNSITLGPRINWSQRLGFSRQKAYSSFSQALDPSSVGIDIPGFTKFPGISVKNFAYNESSNNGYFNVGPSSDFVDAGYFENRLSPSTNAIFALGAHTLTVGFNYNYNQLNIRNNRVGSAQLTVNDFPSLLEGRVHSGSVLLGDSQRYYRSNDVGGFAQDKWQLRSNLSVTAGLRYDFDGPLWEKYGNLFNFDPSRYSVSASTVNNSGFIVAGNNKQYATPGVSDSTLKGRQWGLAPRLGFAWSPSRTHGTQVVRGGFGIYFDRGEYFQYLSPPAGAGISGPFGVTQEAPLASYKNVSGKLDAPFGTAPLGSGQSNPNVFNTLLPTANEIRSGCSGANVYNNASSASNYLCPVVPYLIGNYDVNNKLPYTENWTLDWQWQPRSDLAVNIGYVGNRGRHQIIPLPFNEPKLATPSSPVNGEIYSYGYEVISQATNSSGVPNLLSTEPYDTYSGGNVDLRVPFVGYDPNSTSFRASGVSAYDALQAHLEKRLTHNTQAGVSYTYSHTLDEQSDIGLFFTGDNPEDLRSSYASSDYDRTHILTFNYLFALPSLIKTHNLASYFTNGWALVGLTVLQSGQPYSVYDYSGSVGSQYFGTNVALMNPILPLAPGVKPKQALTGHVGAFLNSSGTPVPALDPTKFQIPLVAPGQGGVPPCDPTGGPDSSGGTTGQLCDVYETDFVPGQRNIFRQPFQKRADVSLQKVTQIHDRYSLQYRFEVFNLTNTPSFDIPTNNITLDPNFGELGGNFVGTQVQPFSAPYKSTPSVTTPSGPGSCVGASQACAYELYTTPANSSNSLGVVTNIIGSPRIIQMSMNFTF